MTQTAAVPPLVNRAMKFVLGSPLHSLVSKTTLLIRFTGCKSGKTFTTPVSYSQHGDEVWIFTHAGWWKNLRGGAPVTLRLRGQERRGLAQPVDADKRAVAAGLTDHLRQVTFDARFYGVTFDAHGQPRPEQVERAAQTVVMIRVRLLPAQGPA